MKTGMPEAQFQMTANVIKSKIGSYVSKEFVGSEKKDGYIIMVYKGKFSQESDDVIIRTVVSETDNGVFVSGFWLDSPGLRR